MNRSRRPRVSSIEAIPVGIPFAAGESPGVAKHHLSEMVLVRLALDSGVVGWGEAFAFGAWRASQAAVEHTVAPYVVGRELAKVSDIRGINDELQPELRNYGRTGPAMFAISGVDLALWDALGKSTGASIAELIGSRTRSSVPVYASLHRYTSQEELLERIGVALSQGYRAIKLHQEDLPLVVAARERTLDRADLMVDVSCGWEAGSAADMFRALAPYSLTWIEEPIFPPEDLAQLAELRSLELVPVAAGENLATAVQARLMLDAGAVDVLQPSVTKAGGVTELLRIIELGLERRVDVHPHSPYFGPGFLATLHLIACRLDPTTTIERYHVDLEAALYPDLLRGHAPELAVPEGPGLGVDPDPDVISRYRLRG
jgi:D-galactarolactone cycloisomerase